MTRDDEMTQFELRTHFIEVYSTVDDENALFRRDRYAKFMATCMPDASETYAREWAQRFRDGEHMHHMDRSNSVEYLKLLTESRDGTGREFSPESLKKAAEEVA